MTTEEKENLTRLSADIRIETIRALASAGYGHIGGAMSIADVLGALYGGILRVDPTRPDWADRDRLVLSKGHAGPTLYAALALRGFFPMAWLQTINRFGTRLPSHCDAQKTPGVDMTTGSLGQGISMAVGIALGGKIKEKDFYTYCIVGDGELQEGQVWEAAQAAANLSLGRLIVFVDDNKKQLDGATKPIDTAARFACFGWDALTVPGYDTGYIADAVAQAKEQTDKPTVIVLDTYKGLGCCFAETVDFNHYMDITPGMARQAVDEIERRYAAGCYPRGEVRW